MTRTTAFTVTAIVAMSVALGGCGVHYKLAAPIANIARSGLVKDRKQLSRLEKAATDGEIANVLDLDVKAKVPTTLAIAKLDSHCSGYQPSLKRIDADELEAWEKIISKHNDIRGVQPVSNLAFDNTLRASDGELSLRSLRLAAARLHCELLLVYMQADTQANEFNNASILYWSILGLWVSPGNTVEHKTVMQAVLVDCRTGSILGTATGSGHNKTDCPSAFSDIQEKKLADKTSSQAGDDLRGGCDRLILSAVSRALAGR